jgi:hypothetical protein
MPGFGLKSVIKQVDTTITALGTGFAMSDLLLLAASANSGNVYVGGSDVSATNGMLLSKTVPIKISQILTSGNSNSFNLASIYGIGTAASDKIIFTYAVQDNSAV